MQHFLNSLFILLIEPSLAQRKIISQQFEDLGISQFEACSEGRDALDIIESEQPDLVISAMYLPDMTGKEVVLEMRESPISQDTPFMLISSMTSFEELNPIKQAGASAVLPKPFSSQDLKRAISMIMDWDNPEQLDFVNVDLEEFKILIVDDSAMARRLISRTLNNLGFENIDEAENGRNAIPFIQQNHYQLVVTDYNMPEMDGYDLVRYIRQKSDQPDVPVMMVTTEGDEGKLSAVQHEGVAAILDKPFAVETIKPMIESIVSNA